MGTRSTVTFIERFEDGEHPITTVYKQLLEYIGKYKNNDE